MDECGLDSRFTYDNDNDNNWWTSLEPRSQSPLTSLFAGDGTRSWFPVPETSEELEVNKEDSWEEQSLARLECDAQERPHPARSIIRYYLIRNHIYLITNTEREQSG